MRSVVRESQDTQGDSRSHRREGKAVGSGAYWGAAPSNPVRTLSIRQGQPDAKCGSELRRKAKPNHHEQENRHFPQFGLPLPLAATSRRPHGNRVELRGCLAHLTLGTGR